MRVLITGAAGFVGRWLARGLQCAGDEVCGLVRPGGSRAPEGMATVEADLRDPVGLAAAVAASEPDAICHLAGLTSGALRDEAALFEANVTGTLNVLNASDRLGRPVRVLLASSGYVYGECDAAHPASEETPATPIGCYARSKWEMECAAREAARPPLALLIARAFNHTGPEQDARFAVPSFARQIAAAERKGADAALQVGDLTARRDFLDVRDVVRAYRLILSHGLAGEVYNVASGSLYTMNEVLDRLAAQARVAVRTARDPERMRPSDLRASVGSAAKLHALCGWTAEIPLDGTLADTLDYWRGRE